MQVGSVVKDLMLRLLPLQLLRLSGNASLRSKLWLLSKMQAESANSRSRLRLLSKTQAGSVARDLMPRLLLQQLLRLIGNASLRSKPLLLLKLQARSVVRGSMLIIAPKLLMAPVIPKLINQEDHLDLVSQSTLMALEAQKVLARLASTGKVLTIPTAQEV